MGIVPPRDIGSFNWLGVWTHISKEIHRFLKVGLQTLAAPVVTTLLFLAIFTLALGRAVQVIGGVPFVEFLAPGLIIMAIIQNAYANTVSSVMISKIQGNIVDMLMPPLSPGEFITGFVLGGVARGVLVAICVGLAIWIFVPLKIHSIWLILFHAFAASSLLAMIGLLTGIIAEKFDHQASISNFIITPLSFLSGTFYSIERLPEFWQFVALANPFFYMIDGFRYGFIGHADASLMLGAAILLALNVVLWFVCYWAVATGYKLKS
ncbi:MAG: multidrug ABC transporter permease [Rhodospirillaceae bacterium]|nr:multidrug ABC transporter permease [Rhodospirillaceae bacterium]|tara:strand:- start:8305 stop:9099 length:795 start_codon:yes stop_codon:yes gene_type:complete